MSVPTYESYRDSGIEWLGEVPAHWAVSKFRHRFRESSEKIDDEVVGPMLSVSGYRGIEIKAYDDENRRRLDDELVGYRIVRPGQLVVNTMWLNYAGLGVSPYEGHVSPAYRSYWVRPGLEGKYVHHLMRSSIYVEGYTRLLTGIRPNSLQMSRDDLMEFPIVVPPPDEQTAIAAFLDRETGKIDALVEAQRRLIELLKEKRQAVISHAVTMGLDPTVPMKDSGVEWLGKIPAHWEVSRLKFVARIQTGVAKGKAYDEEDTREVPYLRVANVQDGWIDVDDVATIELPIGDIERYRLRAGDVLMNEGGDFDKLGRGAIWDGSIDPCVHQNHVFSVRPVAVSPEWLDLTTSSNAAQFFFKGRSKQSTNLASISSTNVMELPLLIPPSSEQTSIVEHVTYVRDKLDALMSEVAQAIALLHEHRAALVSAAVTGTIDVRGLAPHQAEAA